MRRYIFLLVSIVVLLLLTIPTIVSGRFTFAFDMGRDMLWTRNMVELKLPTLIGPWGSIAGVYFGPLWFYLLSIPYLIFKGDPRGAVLVPLAANLLTMIIGWQFLRKYKHPIAGNIFAILYSVSPLIISISSFAFHANLLPLITLLFFIGLFSYRQQPITNNQQLLTGLPLSALMASIAYHLEPAAAVMLTGFFGLALIFTLVKIRWQIRTPKLRSSTAWTETTSRRKHTLGRILIITAISFAIPFAPQLIFELRHDFIQTRSLMAYFSGENTSLGGVLPLRERIIERGVKVGGTFTYSLFTGGSHLRKIVLLALFIFALLSLIKLKKKFKTDEFTVHCSLFTVYFTLFHYVAYTFLFPAELKGWYLYGFVSCVIFATSLVLEKVWKQNRVLGVSFIVVLILLSGSARRLAALNRFPVTAASPDALSAQLSAVDWTYADALADGRPFSIYTYTPPIYDYNYQYLIWWRGTRRFGILPAEYSYVPGESSYVPWKERFQSQKWSPKDARIAYLILEPDRIQDRIDGWLGNFTSLNHVLVQKFDSGLTVEKRSFP